MKIIVVLYVFLLLLMSCNNSRNNLLKEIDDKDLTLLEYDYCCKKNHSHASDSVTFVPLETNDKSLISSITKILYKNEMRI
ncbi:6-bladed beta-propeller [Bacteroides sp. AN502(2024)]|uniref:6-bladed beta-propeller n=1 Tax=Bacteroides sp. AN502(2024) TaxID=3160599 RepID=UPI0035160734